MRTSAVKRLVEQALASLAQPYNEDVIDDVFFAIEHRMEWRQEYEDLCVDLTKTVVNNWVGVWVSRNVGRSSAHQVPSKKTKLAASYSRLTSAAAKMGGKRKESDALEAMSAYYFAHRDELPADIKKYRESILDLLIDGASAEEAFAAMRQHGK